MRSSRWTKSRPSRPAGTRNWPRKRSPAQYNLQTTLETAAVTAGRREHLPIRVDPPDHHGEVQVKSNPNQKVAIRVTGVTDPKRCALDRPRRASSTSPIVHSLGPFVRLVHEK